MKARGIETTVEDLVLEALERHGYTDQDSKCLVQCFELPILEYVRSHTAVNLLYLTNRPEVAGNPEVLQNLQDQRILFICVNKGMLLHTDNSRHCDQEPNEELIYKIKSFGLKLFAYTFKTETNSLCWENAGDYRNELETFYNLGLDGYFSDFPNTVHSFLQEKFKREESYGFLNRLATIFKLRF